MPEARLAGGTWGADASLRRIAGLAGQPEAQGRTRVGGSPAHVLPWPRRGGGHGGPGGGAGPAASRRNVSARGAGGPARPQLLPPGPSRGTPATAGTLVGKAAAQRMSRGAVQGTVPLSWSRSDARRFLARYHLSPGSLEQIVSRLGSIQYDPLRPVGRNPDLVLQARVPGYRVDSWETSAYGDRQMIDAWDKQACLVLPSDWRYRWVYHDHFRERWEERVLTPYAEQVDATLVELAARGPLTSLDFENQERVEAWQGSWYGAKLVKVIMRALWDSGMVVTHHRVKGRHAYALPEQVIPQEVQGSRSSEEEALKFIIRRRHQSMGLLRANAQQALWSIPAKPARRRLLLEALVEEGELIPIEIEGERYHLRRAELQVMDWPSAE